MALVRPRLNDYYDLPFTQEQVDFAIPFLDEDIPLSLDPFLMWKSPSLQDNALHGALLDSFNYIGHLAVKGDETRAIETLILCSECAEVGLGTAKNRKGHRIGDRSAKDILALFRDVPHVQKGGFSHLEEVQLLVEGIGRDRISDISCSLLKSFLIDYTVEQCVKYGIPRQKTSISVVYDYRKKTLSDEVVDLPVTPHTNEPVLLVPKRWLRYTPWINFDDYYGAHFLKEVHDTWVTGDRVPVLNYNRANYGMVQDYIKAKERCQEDCHNDPLFNPIPITSAKKKLSFITKLPTGKSQNSDREFEDKVCQLMASLLYPHMDFAAEQSRTDSGVLIRDLVFYNNRSMDFLEDIHKDYGSRQIVMELKNVHKVEREHINQLNRYLTDHLGRFGVLVTRNPLPRSIYRNTIDLWAGQRKCIIALTDEDLRLMVAVYESKQRSPIEVIKAKYIEFIRSCPA